MEAVRVWVEGTDELIVSLEKIDGEWIGIVKDGYEYEIVEEVE